MGVVINRLFSALVCQCIKNAKDIRTNREVVATWDFSCIFLYFVFYALLFYAVFNVLHKDIWTSRVVVVLSKITIEINDDFILDLYIKITNSKISLKKFQFFTILRVEKLYTNNRIKK